MPPTDAAGAFRSGSTRSTPLVLLVIAGVLLAARIVVGIVERPETAETAAMQEAVDLVEWRTPGAAALAEAQEKGKPILYDFMADWCGPCHTMQREVFASPATAAMINDTFVPVRVADRQQEEGRNTAEVDALQRAYRIEAFPTLVVVSPDGGRHESQEGYLGSAGTVGFLTSASGRVMDTAR